MEKIICNLSTGWVLRMAPNAEVVSRGFDPKTIAELSASDYCAIDASVPGNFELDLVSAGLMPDPYFAQNPFLFQQFENRHLWYSTVFDADTVEQNTFLVFEGIDTVADIYLNGELLGHTENMFMAHEFKPKNLKKKGNELIVHILPVTIYARDYELKPMHNAQRYNYDSLPIRKAPSMYGWDIMPRFVSGGIWKPVRLVSRPSERIEQFYIYTPSLNIEDEFAHINIFFHVDTDADFTRGLKIWVEGSCGDSKFACSQELWHTYGNMFAEVRGAKFWWPRNYGESPMYDVKVTLTRDGVVCDEYHTRFGIRKIDLVRTSTTDTEGRGEFYFKVNGKPVFCMGTNWVPLDAFHSRDIDRLHPSLDMLSDLGCNIVRCWGGNVYENDDFFNYCDDHGIMVWQDFAMGCATYPQDSYYADALYREAAFIIKRLRNHPSLALWAGDNEVDLAYSWNGYVRNPNYNELTRDILAKAVREYDVIRDYLPSSPYIDDYAFKSGMPTSEDHLWGPRDYFKGDYYKNTVCHFASETGYHGCPSPMSLEKFIEKKNIWPILNDDDYPNNDWICHSACMEPGPAVTFDYRVPLMINQVKNLFGEMADNIDDFAKQSQISQAEAKKYFVERFRITKWRRTGIIWWNLVDGWPQISDAIVDWYHCKKLAYSFIKRSQQRLCLMFDEPKNGEFKLYAANDFQTDKSIQYKVTDITNGITVCEGHAVVCADESTCIATLSPYTDQRLLLIEWESEDGVCGKNHHITQTLNISYVLYMNDIKKCGFDLFEGFEE